jgi:hypothetical protein
LCTEPGKVRPFLSVRGWLTQACTAQGGITFLMSKIEPRRYGFLLQMHLPQPGKGTAQIAGWKGRERELKLPERPVCHLRLAGARSECAGLQDQEAASSFQAGCLVGREPVQWGQGPEQMQLPLRTPETSEGERPWPPLSCSALPPVGPILEAVTCVGWSLPQGFAEQTKGREGRSS